MAARDGERGYAALIIVMLLAVAGFAIASSVDRSGTGLKTIHAAKQRSTQYYQAEASLGRAVSWLRQNSQRMLIPFRRQNFYDAFDRTAPSVGSNDTSLYTVPSKLKMEGTNDTVMVSNDASLGTSYFPFTEDIHTGVTFDVASQFAAADLGDSKVRITLFDAIAKDPSKDYGDPSLGNPAPETDFYPVYRIDAFNGTDRGAHVYTTVSGKLINVFDLGIYGEDILEARQQCDSYLSTSGSPSYASGNRRANCTAGSNSTAQIHVSEQIYGSLQTNGTINAEPPFGGHTCADFEPNCPNAGETCAGEDCGVPLLEQFEIMATYCPSNQGNYTGGGSLPINDTNSNGDIDVNERCWGTVTIPNNTTLTLSATNSPYYIDTLTLQNNSNSRLNVAPNPADGVVELYVRQITGDSFNGNQIVNAGRPVSFRLYYLGTNDLTLNGTAAINAGLVAPNAGVTVSGNFDYNGALLARELYLTGSGGIHYDESFGGEGLINDVQYRLKELVQYYR